MRALALLSLAAIGAFLACATAPIGTYDKGDDTSGDDGTSGGDGASTPSGNPTLSVSIGGTGTGTVSANGLTCSGTSCTGTYASGTKVTITATAGTGSTFVGWAGACSGTEACEATVSGTTVVTATFASGGSTSTLAGTWSGTYTHSMTVGGNCTFMNGGNLSATLVPADAGTSVASTVQADGFELRAGNPCQVRSKEPATASANLTSTTPTTISGEWPFNVQGAGNNPLRLPFTATIAGTTMTGQWTCTGCTGNFTLTRK